MSNPLAQTLPIHFSKFKIGHDTRITQMIEVPHNQQEKHISDYKNFHQRTLQQWPYTDVGMMTYLDDEYPQIVFQRMSTIFQNLKDKSHSFVLYEQQKHQEIILSQVYPDQKIVNALKIVSSQFKYIVRIIEQNESNAAGMWAVWLCVTGEWKLVVMDDTIPCTLKGNTIIPSTSQIVEGCWNMILEKAIVKQLGGKFANLNRLYNDTTDSFVQMLTGLPIQKIQSTFTKDLIQHLQMEFILYCEIDNNKYLESSFPMKLEDAAYLIVKIEKNILTLRATENKFNLQIGQKSINDEFLVSLIDFQNIFSEVSVIKAHQNYKFTWLSLESSYKRCIVNKDIIECDSAITFEVEVKYINKDQEDTHIYLSICQVELNQIVPNVRANFTQQYALVRVIIAKLGYDDSYQFICGDLSYQRQTTLDIFLPSGKYIVMTQIYFPSAIQSILKQDPRFNMFQQKATIQFYAAHLPINIQYWDGDYLNLENKIISSIALSMQSQQNSRDYKSQEEKDITVTTLMTLGLLIFYYCNKGSSILNEEIRFQERINLLKYDGEVLQDTDSFHVEVYPSNELLVIYKYDPIQAINPLAEFSYNCVVKAQLQCVGSDRVQSKISNTKSKYNQHYSPDLQDMCQVDTTPQKYTTNDLMKFMQDFGKVTKRVWQEKPIEVYMYIYQHYKGAILMFQNQSSHPYEENVNFELHNLEIKCKVQPYKDVVQFILEPYSHLFVYLDAIISQSEFGYKFQSHYKYYPE